MNHITRAFVLLLLGGFVAKASAQRPLRVDGDLLNRTAALEIEDVSLEEALASLGIRSGVQLAFSSDELKRQLTVRCSCTDVTVGQALDSLLSGTGLKYRVSRGRVIVGSGEGGLFFEEPNAPRLQRGSLVGLVISKEDGSPLVAAAVQVSGRLGEIRTDEDGRFSMTLRSGIYDITVRALGYAPHTVQELEVVDGEVDSITVALERTALRLSDIVVTPSTYGILKPEVIATQQTLTRAEIYERPHFAEDLYRALYHLPGVTTHDVSASLQVRGSNNNEVLQTLDGLELYEPLHLQDIGGALSIIDVEAVADLGLSTGGFTAEYGDKLTGVFAMRSTTPQPDRTTATVGASLMNFTFKSQGGFGGGNGAWLISARRGFLDIILDLLGETEDIRPTYYDLFTKVQYQLGTSHLVSLHGLHAGDKFFMREDDDTEVRSGWGSSYVWANWQADFSSALMAHTVLSAGRVTRDRAGSDVFDWDPSLRRLRVDDRATLDFYGLRQDWSLLLSERSSLRWGFDAKRAAADYDYLRWRLDWIPNFDHPFAPPYSPHYDSVTVDLQPTGHELSTYVSARVRPVDRLTLEFGLRYDLQSHTSEKTLSPRLNLAFDLAPHTAIRGAWGRFYQSHDLRDLDVMNGVTQFYPAQHAEHRIVGLSHAFRDGTSIRVEAYERRISNPWPEYRDLQPEMTDVVQEEYPEHILRVDPARALARGIELLVKRDGGGPFAWAATYALAEANDQIDGEWFPRPRDQRHAVHLEFALRPNSAWSLSGGWHYHSAWPGTELEFAERTLANGDRYIEQAFGPMYALRLPAYHRFDLRMSRHVSLGRGRLTMFVDIFNLYGRPNVETYEYFWSLESDRLDVYREYEDMIGMLPNIGVRWEF